MGISSVYVTRKLTNDSFAFISYLVDFWCLGLKDTIVKLGVSNTDLEYIYSKNEDLETISYEDARSLILGAIDFAKSIHIAPRPTWNGIPSNFIEADLPYKKKFSFGHKGKPVYVSGPYDHELYNIEELASKISKAKGHYTILI